MKPRQLLKQFKEVPWLSQQQLDEVAEECLADGIDAGTVGRLLAMLLDKKLAGDNWQERMRLGLFQRIAKQVRDPSLCQPYVRALSEAPVGLRQFLLGLIPQVEHANAHAELCELLRSPDKNLRMAILEMLPNM